MLRLQSLLIFTLLVAVVLGALAASPEKSPKLVEGTVVQAERFVLKNAKGEELGQWGADEGDAWLVVGKRYSDSYAELSAYPDGGAVEVRGKKDAHGRLVAEDGNG